MLIQFVFDIIKADFVFGEFVMNFVEYMDYLENRYQITLPSLYKQLAKDGMLDWKTEHENWRIEIYPQLIKNPPFLFHVYELELPSSNELIDYTDNFLPSCDNGDGYYLKQEFQNRIIIFATCGNGDSYGFYYHDKEYEPQILRVCHDKESEFVADSFQHFMIYKLLEVANIGTDSNPDEFRKELLAQLKTHRPYLTKLQSDSLSSIYQGEFKSDGFGYQILLSNQEFDNWLNHLIPSDKQDDEIEIFEFDFQK